MITMREIYDEKLNIKCNEDISDLAEKISDKNPELYITNNFDRTFLLSYENNEILNQFHSTILDALESWLDSKLTCDVKYVYNILPLNKNQCILKI